MRGGRLITNSSFDTPGRPLIRERRWKTINELVSGESVTMVFMSLNGLAPHYISDLFALKSICSSHGLPNTGTDLKLPVKSQQLARVVSFI